MFDFLRDSTWQFAVATLIGVSAIVVSIVAYVLQRNRKLLIYEIISSTPLVSVKDEVEGKLQIIYDGAEVSDVHLVVVRISNSGNVPITSNDYDRPLIVYTGVDSRILSVEVSETEPKDLKVAINADETTTVLQPLLLNGGDSVTIRLLVTRLVGVHVDGRIVGVKDIKESKEIALNKPGVLMFAIGLVLVVSGYLWYLFLNPSALNFIRPLISDLPTTILLFGLVLMLAGILITPRYREVLYNNVFRSIDILMKK